MLGGHSLDSLELFFRRLDVTPQPPPSVCMSVTLAVSYTLELHTWTPICCAQLGCQLTTEAVTEGTAGPADWNCRICALQSGGGAAAADLGKNGTAGGGGPCTLPAVAADDYSCGLETGRIGPPSGRKTHSSRQKLHQEMHFKKTKHTLQRNATKNAF